MILIVYGERIEISIEEYIEALEEEFESFIEAFEKTEEEIRGLIEELEDVAYIPLSAEKKDIFKDKYQKQPEKSYKEIHKKVDALARSPPEQHSRFIHINHSQVGRLKKPPFEKG